jgi:hypothetical protein
VNYRYRGTDGELLSLSTTNQELLHNQLSQQCPIENPTSPLTERKALSSDERDFVERLLRVAAPLTVVTLSALRTRASADVGVDA